jgi:hypothetical protein
VWSGRLAFSVTIANAAIKAGSPLLWPAACRSEIVYELRMLHRPACKVCGHPIVAARDHDIPAPRAAKMFTSFTCNCGKPARVRCFNGLRTYFIECEDGHGRPRPA